ncbi:MAG: CocE/NonD family hydrolase [Verrucomicrobiales bacterium]|nr:CocE/NonD family hydrolase [Verrucomicrobiales bacterium]MCP5556137.1 CocE/NonD family hydrolase [Verrucomicrobiaceae bacterium]
MKFIILSLIATAALAETHVETLQVQMRDGIHLATDVYRDDDTAKAPVVLVRTPYNKDKAKGTAELFVKAGFVAVIQDCRGANASEGIMIPYDNEGQDGFDCIEWITRQPWCSGRVGMWGASYVGATQWQAAVEKPPGLVTITPRATWSSFYRNLYLGGAVRLSLIAKWAGGNSERPEGATPPTEWDPILSHLPLSEVDDTIGWPIPWLEGMLTHPQPNGYWNRLNLTPQITDLDMPMQHIVGYYDFFSRESVGNFMIMQKQARDPKIRAQQQLILGPWDHGSIGKSKVGDVDFGPEATVDTMALNLDWFARYLKQDTAAQAKPFAPVRYFVMGDNAWREAQTWPPEGFTATSFYLHSDAEKRMLSRTAPTTDQAADTFRADPANPVPACPVTEARPLHAAIWAPVDQSSIETRDDVLAYSTGPLAEPITFAGNLEAKLHVSADTPDADWVVRLVDVHPDGFAQNLAVGILRGRYRDSLMNPQPLEPGKVYEITVDLGPCAATIAKGHQLNVDISGAYFPLFDRNPNTGEGPFGSKTALATESVHHRPGALSRIILPCLNP